MLTIENVCAGYGQLRVLHDVSLHVKAGETVTVLGANGAGKTTLLKTILGLTGPYAGRILLENEPLDHLPTHERIRLGMGAVLEHRGLFADMSVIDNLRLACFVLSPRPNRDEVNRRLKEIWSIFPALKDKQHDPVNILSGGQQQMVAIARALIQRPKILLLDEPSTGLAPIMVQEIFDIFKQLKDAGLTILLVEQNTHKALSLADRAYVLSLGRVTLSGEAEKLKRDSGLVASYIGG